MTAFFARHWLTIARLCSLPVMICELYQATARVDSLDDTWGVIALSVGCVLLAVGDDDEVS